MPQLTYVLFAVARGSYKVRLPGNRVETVWYPMSFAREIETIFYAFWIVVLLWAIFAVVWGWFNRNSEAK